MTYGFSVAGVLCVPACPNTEKPKAAPARKSAQSNVERSQDSCRMESSRSLIRRGNCIAFSRHLTSGNGVNPVLGTRLALFGPESRPILSYWEAIQRRSNPIRRHRAHAVFRRVGPRILPAAPAFAQPARPGPCVPAKGRLRAPLGAGGRARRATRVFEGCNASCIDPESGEPFGQLSRTAPPPRRASYRAAKPPVHPGSRRSRWIPSPLHKVRHPAETVSHRQRLHARVARLWGKAE